jgi:hypothetical protein
MPASKRKVTPADILPYAEFAQARAARRAALLPKKKLRRVEVGPHATFYFECFDTMLFQIQEMLHIEKGGADQIEDEIRAYNPLIPQGDELIATIMFEIDEAERRERVLARLGGVEEHFFVQIGSEKIRGVQESDTERTREDGKASSVHFAHFHFGDAQKKAFADPNTQVILGVDHAEYAHMALLSATTRAELAQDFN